MKRRQFLQLSLVGAGIVGVSALTGCDANVFGGSRSAIKHFTSFGALPIPPLLEAIERDGKQVFSMVVEEGTSTIVPAGTTSTWGVNGPLLGPTLRAKRGTSVHVDVTNDLPTATSMHWHGMHVPSDADGGPHSEIAPGQTWSPEWTVEQPAATLWYHPHPHGETEIHVYKGLGGFFIVDDDDEPEEFPHEYGIDDIPVIVQDKSFDESGELVETNRVGVGMLGDTIITNGLAGATFTVTAQRTRLRLLNGSTARTYCFGLSDDRSFHMVASDGGRLASPSELNRILLTPGERAEIIVAMAPEETIMLRSFAHDLGVARSRNGDAGADDDCDVMQLTAASSLTTSPPLPQTLSTEEALEESDAVEVREFLLGDNKINGLSMDMNRVDAAINSNAVEIWEVENTHSQPHNFHIHDVQFRILDIDGAAPAPELAGPKDTIYTPPGVKFRLIMHFGDNRSPEIPYMYHCHLLWHEDEGMMGQFTVGNDDGKLATSAHHH